MVLSVRKLLLTGLMMLGAASASAQDYPEIHLRFGHFAPPSAVHAQVDAWFAEELKKRTNGNVTEQIFWSGAVGQASELLDLVGQGALDVAAVPASYFPQKLPLLAAPSSLPLALNSPDHAHRVMRKLWETVPEMRKEAEAQNVHPLLFHSLNNYHLLCTKPVRSLSDLEGLKVRSQGDYIPLALNAVRAVPVTVLPAEFYESLQRGNVDCMLLPWDLMTAFKLQEVAKFGSTIDFGALISNPQWYNLARFNGLPQNLRDLMEQTADEGSTLDLEKLKSSEKDAIQTMKDAGVEFIDFPDQEKFEALLPDFLEVWYKKMETAGMGEAAAKVVAIWREQ